MCDGVWGCNCVCVLVEVRQRPVRSGAGGRGPAGNAAILHLRFRSGGEHWQPLRSGGERCHPELLVEDHTINEVPTAERGWYRATCWEVQGRLVYFIPSEKVIVAGS